MSLRTLRRTLADSRGSILAGGLMLVFVLTLLGLAFLDIAVVENRLIAGDDCVARGMYAAEAGLQLAYRDLVNGSAIGSVDYDGVFNDATYKGANPVNLTGHVNRTLSGSGAQPTTYTVQAQASGTASNSVITLWSTGASAGNCFAGPSPVTVRGQVGRTTSTGHSFVAGSDMTIGGSGALLDSFDSSKGPYNCLGGTAGCTVPNGTRNVCQQTTSPFTCGIDIWVNGDPSVKTDFQNGPIYANIVSAGGKAVNFKTSTSVYGTFTWDTGDGNAPTCNPSNCSQIKGGVIGQTGILPFTLPPVNDCRTHGGFSSSSYVAARIPTGSYTYDATSGVFTTSGNIAIDPGGSAGNFCFSSFNVGGDLTIPSTVTNAVVINIGSSSSGTTVGKATLSGNIVNSTGQSKYLQIFSISNNDNDDIKVSSGSGSYVFAYAPNGQVQVKSGGAFFGAALGHKLSATGGSQLHFDKALLSIVLPGIGSGTPTYSFENWTRCHDPACT